MKLKEGDIVFYNPEPFDLKRPWYKTKVAHARTIHGLHVITIYAYFKGVRGKNKGIDLYVIKQDEALKDGVIVPLSPALQVLFATQAAPRGFQDLTLVIP